ncbi:MAG: phospholipid/cholesterol/gamma-HCH transport system substrate-binding protein [Thermoleophilaceae bacterium]|nr:phospholipid/cholesterol/gamma-HCH transport system substrate-binding protein [Thermoleophilaceae bacterium]MEA2401995.1 phospholipid/cholesterol/gamma-HCH transport system substrate-binding protein [Thermoleophilaceae bacterium]MEA2456857.1 phospholipid/cholesterol/gamma-HCH transport system substrate-binding protein [Thermoleophilaceae bacterium]
MRRVAQDRIGPFGAGLIAIVLILIGTFLAFTKDIPFTKPFELRATFENAPPIQKNQAVRIAGVDVGRVSKVEPVGGDSPAIVVTMKLKDDALPIHKDATIKVRPRIFFEGNLFFDIHPGTPSSPEVGDGDTIPASQTSAPVQLDQVLGSLQADTRKNLQKLLIGYGGALNAKPLPGEDDDQSPEVRGKTGGQALNQSLQYSAEALRGSAVVNQALLGTDLHDLSKLVGGQQKVFAALSRHEGSLKDLITNFNTTTGALAAEQDNLRETVRLLPGLLEAANPALDKLNAAFPPTRAWALEMIPGVRETPATIKAAFPWITQTRALLRPSELQGLVKDLQPAVDDFARFTQGQVKLLPAIDLFNRCQLNVILPTGDTRIDDGTFSTGLRNYEEFFQTLVGLAGESQNFDGNGSYTRFMSGGGAYRVQTPPVRQVNSPGPLFGSAVAPPLGTRPARTAKPPYKPNAPCYKQQPPDLNAAPIGAGP